MGVVIVLNACNPTAYKADAEDQKLKVILGYMVGLRIAWATGDTALNCSTIRNLVIFIRFTMIEIMS